MRFPKPARPVIWRAIITELQAGLLILAKVITHHVLGRRGAHIAAIDGALSQRLAPSSAVEYHKHCKAAEPRSRLTNGPHTAASAGKAGSVKAATPRETSEPLPTPRSPRERCWSGRTGAPGKRVGASSLSWVRIPPSPPSLRYNMTVFWLATPFGHLSLPAGGLYPPRSVSTFHPTRVVFAPGLATRPRRRGLPGTVGLPRRGVPLTEAQWEARSW